MCPYVSHVGEHSHECIGLAYISQDPRSTPLYMIVCYATPKGSTTYLRASAVYSFEVSNAIAGFKWPGWGSTYCGRPECTTGLFPDFQCDDGQKDQQIWKASRPAMPWHWLDRFKWACGFFTSHGSSTVDYSLACLDLFPQLTSRVSCNNPDSDHLPVLLTMSIARL
jgi:hypothetical protein